MRVIKFGGTSVGSAERLKKAAHLAADIPGRKIVVLSAMAGTTNSLLEICDHLIRKNSESALGMIAELENKYRKAIDGLLSGTPQLPEGEELIRGHFDNLRSFTLDLFTPNEVKPIVAQGELLSTAMISLYYASRGIPSVLIPALNFMRIDREQEPDFFYIKENIQRELGKYPDTTLFVTEGFICRNAFGEIDNLKRGGSDYTASLVGAATGASEIQIWTDIDGFHDNDPRFVAETHTIPELSFDEAAELAYFGAKILHPSTIQPAKLAGIPVVIRNTMDPSALGTRITDSASGAGIKAVAAKDGITAIRVKSGRMLLAYGFLRKVFEIFEIYKTPIDMITTSEISVSVTIDDTTNLGRIIDDLKHYGTVEVDEGQTIICAVGQDIAGNNEAALKILSALGDTGIRMIAYGGSPHNISVLVPSEQKEKALNTLSRQFFHRS